MNFTLLDRRIISGFSKLSKDEKIELISSYADNPVQANSLLKSYWHTNDDTQRLFDEFSENTVSNYHFPYGIAPNFLINGSMYFVPMVTEESSVVAAAAKSAKFWAERGGFEARVISMKKVGQVHFIWQGDKTKLFAAFPEIKRKFIRNTLELTSNMVSRGGGILDIELIDMTSEIDDYFQIKAHFDTRDSMGANFINSCLEEFARTLEHHINTDEILSQHTFLFQVIMAILSNYTPDCLVNVKVECDNYHFNGIDGSMNSDEFLWKFEKAALIAEKDVYRATTHNKGIFNGIDAVALATGNDFRAIEAGGHTFAARNGSYRSLTEVKNENGIFTYSLTVPLSVGTVGGLTKLHPLANFSLKLLGNPSAEEMMKIAATAGLANNFSAVKSLITKGIQVGHMKMHLLNIMNHFRASKDEKERAVEFFKTHKVSFRSVEDYLNRIRHNKH